MRPYYKPNDLSSTSTAAVKPIAIATIEPIVTGKYHIFEQPEHISNHDHFPEI